MRGTASNTSYTKERRKLSGSFFTPKCISDFLAAKMLEFCQIQENYNILDPATGDSALLLSLKEVLDRTGKHYRFVGIDTDKKAVNKSASLIKDNAWFIETDALYPFGKKDWSGVENLCGIKIYDLICSNPPWGASLSNYQNLKKDYISANGQFDIYDIFVEIILSKLKYGGVYGLILPDSLYSLEHELTRNMIFNKTSVKVVIKLGEGFFSNVYTSASIIIGINEKPQDDNLISCYHITRNERQSILKGSLSLISLFNNKSYSIKQCEAVNKKTNSLNVFVSYHSRELFEKINSNSTLGDYVEIHRGVELSKKGIVIQCPNCGFWRPLPRGEKRETKCNHCSNTFSIVSQRNIIHSTHQKGNKRIIVGEDIDRYGFSQKHYIEQELVGINYKEISYYRAPKILIRKTGVGITANIDYTDSFTNQVVYIIRSISPEIISNEVILAIINSRIITYYVINAFGNIEWQSHPYISQSTIRNLPFPISRILNCEFSKVIVGLKELVKKAANGNLSKALDAAIEINVAHLFEITKEEFLSIIDCLQNTQQLIPFCRLLDKETLDFITNGI